MLHLQLQNLLYEVLHLQKEISKCLEFKLVHYVSFNSSFGFECTDKAKFTQSTVVVNHYMTYNIIDLHKEDHKTGFIHAAFIKERLSRKCHKVLKILIIVCQSPV